VRDERREGGRDERRREGGREEKGGGKEGGRREEEGGGRERGEGRETRGGREGGRRIKVSSLSPSGGTHGTLHPRNSHFQERP
jgi:hypothetical protein